MNRWWSNFTFHLIRIWQTKQKKYSDHLVYKFKWKTFFHFFCWIHCVWNQKNVDSKKVIFSFLSACGLIDWCRFSFGSSGNLTNKQTNKQKKMKRKIKSNEQKKKKLLHTLLMIMMMIIISYYHHHHHKCYPIYFSYVSIYRMCSCRSYVVVVVENQWRKRNEKVCRRQRQRWMVIIIIIIIIIIIHNQSILKEINVDTGWDVNIDGCWMMNFFFLSSFLLFSSTQIIFRCCCCFADNFFSGDDYWIKI